MWKITFFGLDLENRAINLVHRALFPGFLGKRPEGGGGGGTPHMKVVGMLVVSLRVVYFGFWSHLGCSGQNAIIFSREGLV